MNTVLVTTNINPSEYADPRISAVYDYETVRYGKLWSARLDVEGLVQLRRVREESHLFDLWYDPKTDVVYSRLRFSDPGLVGGFSRGLARIVLSDFGRSLLGTDERVVEAAAVKDALGGRFAVDRRGIVLENRLVGRLTAQRPQQLRAGWALKGDRVLYDGSEPDAHSLWLTPQGLVYESAEEQVLLARWDDSGEWCYAAGWMMGARPGDALRVADVVAFYDLPVVYRVGDSLELPSHVEQGLLVNAAGVFEFGAGGAALLAAFDPITALDKSDPLC